MSYLRRLSGATVSGLVYGPDSLHLLFSNGANLSIFNRFTFSGADLSNLEGETVKSADESDALAIVSFSDGSSIRVGLRDEDYIGPEAIELVIPGKPNVVWN